MCKTVVRSALPFFVCLFVLFLVCFGFFFWGGGGLHGIPAIVILLTPIFIIVATVYFSICVLFLLWGGGGGEIFSSVCVCVGGGYYGGRGGEHFPPFVIDLEGEYQNYRNCACIATVTAGFFFR